MHVFCLCALPYIYCKIAFCFSKVPDVFTRPRDFTQYGVSILKIWWEIFRAFGVAKCDTTVAKVS